MKKAILSLGTILLSGVVLASCSFGGGISKLKAPKKGKKVDSISVQFDEDYTLDLKQGDEYKDICSKITSHYYYMGLANKNYAAGYEEYRKEKLNYKESFYFSSTRDILDNTSVSEELTNYSDNYAYYENKDGKVNAARYSDEIRKSKSNNNYGKYVEKSNSNFVMSRADKASKDNASNDYSFESASKQKGINEYTEKYISASESQGNEGAMYTYLTGSGKTTDDNYNNYYSARIPGLYSYSYTISGKVNLSPSFGSEVSLYPFIFNEAYGDLVEYSYELTDSEIILKAKASFSVEAYDYAYDKCSIDGDTSDEKVISCLKDDVLKNEFKGSYIEAEIWIRYDQKYNPDDQYYSLRYSYYDYVSYNNFNISEEITKENYEDIIDEEIINDYIGKKYTKKGTAFEQTTYKYNDNNYDKKMDKLFKEAKKNNLLEKLTFQEAV